VIARRVPDPPRSHHDDGLEKDLESPDPNGPSPREILTAYVVPSSDHVGVVEQPVQQRGYRSGAAQQLTLAVDGTVGAPPMPRTIDLFSTAVVGGWSYF
jgi:hypothetical protein